jgi:hypothetical protein
VARADTSPTLAGMNSACVETTIASREGIVPFEDAFTVASEGIVASGKATIPSEEALPSSGITIA